MKRTTKQSHLLSIEWDCFEILNEIASVALLPRNDVILKFLANSKTRGSGSKKLGSKILERFLVLKPLR